jgi:hypothetical protein
VAVNEIDDAVVKRQKPHNYEGPHSINKHKTINPKLKPVADSIANSNNVSPSSKADISKIKQMRTPV